MISCSNCGKSIADDAVHCGHCGHKVERTTNQKTMMGFALSPEDLQKAIAEASQQRASQSAASTPPDDAVDGMARTEMLPSIDGNPALSDTLDPDADSSAPTMQMSSDSFFGGAPDGAAPQEPITDPAMGGPAFGSMPSHTPGPGFGPTSSPAAGPDPFAAQPGPASQPLAPMSQAPLQTTDGSSDGELSFVEKNKKILIIVGAVFALSFGCCILGALYNFVL